MPEPEKMSSINFLCHYIKEIIGAVILIGGGLALDYYAEDISGWFGELIQKAIDSLFSL